MKRYAFSGKGRKGVLYHQTFTTKKNAQQAQFILMALCTEIYDGSPNPKASNIRWYEATIHFNKFPSTRLICMCATCFAICLTFAAVGGGVMLTKCFYRFWATFQVDVFAFRFHIFPHSPCRFYSKDDLIKWRGRAGEGKSTSGEKAANDVKLRFSMKNKQASAKHSYKLINSEFGRFYECFWWQSQTRGAKFIYKHCRKKKKSII